MLLLARMTWGSQPTLPSFHFYKCKLRNFAVVVNEHTGMGGVLLQQSPIFLWPIITFWLLESTLFNPICERCFGKIEILECSFCTTDIKHLHYKTLLIYKPGTHKLSSPHSTSLLPTPRAWLFWQIPDVVFQPLILKYFSQQGAVVPRRRCLAVFGDIFCCPPRWRGCSWHPQGRAGMLPPSASQCAATTQRVRRSRWEIPLFP